MTTPAEVLEHVFTHPNPASGSPPPPAMAWAVFEHGTVFFTTPSETLSMDASFEAIAEAACAALERLGPVVVGSESADFSAIRMSSWYPDEPLWMISYSAPEIATILAGDEDNDLAAGLEGRRRRQQDYDEQKLVVVRRFDGTLRSTP